MASNQEQQQRRQQQQLNDALIEAAKQGSLADIQSLLDRHADINALGCYDSTPLHTAALKGHHQCIELLLDRHANVNARDNIQRTPLHRASWKGHHHCIEILLDRGADKSLINVRLSLSPSAYASISLMNASTTINQSQRIILTP